MKHLSIVASISDNGVIGYKRRTPWKLSSDMLRFKSMTMGQTLIMGRRTAESIGRPLPGRTNILLTRKTGYTMDGFISMPTLAQAIAHAKDDGIFIIGGLAPFTEALPIATDMYLTRVHATVQGDVFFTPDLTGWRLVTEDHFPASEKDEYDSTFYHFVKKP